MSSTIAAVAGTNNSGLGSERHVVYAINSARWWAFGFTGTLTLASWYSADGITWTAGATQALAHVHNSEGRNLSVGYANVSNTDVVHFSLPHKILTNIAWSTIRATISGTVISYHTVETVLNTGSTDAFDNLYWAGTSVEFDSNTLVHIAGGWIDSASNGEMAETTSTTDPGTAEQMTALTWTSHDIDNSQATETRSSYMIDLGAGTMGFIADNGSAALTTTGLEWATWPGSGAWQQGSGLGNVDVTGSISAIDRNDWGAVRRTFTDVHVVYLNAAGALIHRRFDGTNWNNGQTIPSGASPASGTGVALSTDGFSIWLSVIDSDGANTVRTIQWTNGYANGTGADSWAAAWTVTEASSQTRTWIGCSRDIVAQTGLAYWVETSNLVAVAFTAISPDPLWVQTAQTSSTVSQSSLGVAFSTANIATGNRIIVAACIFGTGGAVISSVTDSAGNTYVKDSPACVLSDGTDISIWSAPITLGGGTKPTVTIHSSLAAFVWGMFVHEYVVSNAASAYLDGTAVNNTSAVVSPATSGASSPAPGATGELAFGFYGDTNSQTSITPSAGWTLRGTAILGAGLGEGCCEDQTTVAGTGSNASFAISNTGSAAGIIVVVYKLPPSAAALIGIPTFPLISGLQIPPPQSPTLGLFSTFAQPWSATLGAAQAAAATIAATFVRGERVSPSTRPRSRPVVAVLLTPTFIGTAPLREQKVAPATKSRGRVVLPAVRAASPFPTRPNRTKPSIPIRARPRFVVPATTASATIAAITVRAPRRPPSTRARPYNTVATAAIIIATTTATTVRVLARGPGLRARSRRAVAAPQTVTTGSIRVLRAPTRSPASRSRSVRLRPVVASAFVPSAVSTAPMRVPLLPPPIRARPRVLVSAVPLPLGVAAAIRRNRALLTIVRARPRFVVGANVVLGVPAQARRNRVVFAPTIPHSRRVVPATATLPPGVPPTQQRELRVT